MEIRDKCHECYVETFENGKRWVMKSGGSYKHIMYCPDCGSPLAFDSEGNPVVDASYEELERGIGVLAVELAIGDAKLECDCSANNIAWHVKRTYEWLSTVRRVKVTDYISGPMTRANYGAGGPDGARKFVDRLKA